MGSTAINGGLVPKTDGIVKTTFGQAGDVTGLLGLNPWQFSLVAATPLDIQPPTPLVYVASDTDWSAYAREQGDGDVIYTDATYGEMFIEQNLDKQVHIWRFNIDYARADASADEQLKVTLKNPYSGFSVSGQIQLLKAQLIDEAGVNIVTIADSASVPEAGNGNGYQLSVEATTNVDISIRSIIRDASFTSRPRPFIV